MQISFSLMLKHNAYCIKKLVKLLETAFIVGLEPGLSVAKSPVAVTVNRAKNTN